MPLEYGSEFRTTDLLAKIFRFHPNWKQLKTMLEKGSNWPLVSVLRQGEKILMKLWSLGTTKRH
eukprot:8675818-Ditylum_brightwellii.AAC.1